MSDQRYGGGVAKAVVAILSTWTYKVLTGKSDARCVEWARVAQTREEGLSLSGGDCKARGGGPLVSVESEDGSLNKRSTSREPRE